MLAQLRPALVLFALLTVLTGILYPALVGGVGAVFFRNAAAGSPLRDGDALAGSALVARPFDDAAHFWGRPSATSPACNPALSGGSNLGPTNPALFAAVRARVEALRKLDPENRAPVPIDLVTASGSGLDPHISPAAAEYQAARVARARGVDPDMIRAAIRRRVEAPCLGVIGEPRVNVLLLNLDLDR